MVGSETRLASFGALRPRASSSPSVFARRQTRSTPKPFWPRSIGYVDVALLFSDLGCANSLQMLTFRSFVDDDKHLSLKTETMKATK